MLRVCSLALGGVRSLRPLTVCIAFAVLASAYPAQAAKVYLVGTSYQLRRGQVEGNGDLITPYPPEWTPGPYCFRMAQPIGVTVVADPGETIGKWKVTGASLFSWVFGPYWDLPEGSWRQPGEIQWLWFLPFCIDVVTLVGDVVIEKAVEPPPPAGESAGGAMVTESFGKYSHIYVVLDAPKPPMAPAWASVLNYSCFWAAGAYTSVAANTALTDTLYACGRYNGGVIAYTRGSDEAGETLYLKALIDAGPVAGQCNDFADFLVCLSTSVGIEGIRAQRTNPLYVYFPPPPQPYPGFISRPLKPAGSAQYALADWSYHQFGLWSSTVWDGCINILGYGIPKNWQRDSDYRPRLVLEYKSGCAWSPTPASGFLPAVTTNPLPPGY